MAQNQQKVVHAMTMPTGCIPAPTPQLATRESSVTEHATVAYTNVYGVHGGLAMQRRAKVFMNNRSQAVRLPKEFQFDTDEVFIRKEGEDVILSRRPTNWEPYLESGPVASDAFMENIEDLPVQEREP